MTAITGTASWSPDHIADLDLDTVIPDSLLVVATTKAGEIEGDEPFVRVPFVGADPTAATVAEGAAITPSDATLSEVAFQTTKTAVLSKISNELVRAPGAQARIIKSLQRSVQAKVNADFVDALDAASTGFVNAGTLGTDLDEFSDAIADVESNGGEASHIIMPSSAWKTLSKVKSGTASNVPLLGVGDASTEGVTRSIFGLPVLLNSAAGAIYVVSKADMVSAYSVLRVAVSTDAYFGEDSTGLRADLRFGVAPARPNRHAKIALA
jgi:HK97 family phage major capsid protein